MDNRIKKFYNFNTLNFYPRSDRYDIEEEEEEKANEEPKENNVFDRRID